MPADKLHFMRLRQLCLGYEVYTLPAMKHSRPDLQLDLNSSRFHLLHHTDRVAEQDFLGSHLQKGRWKPMHIGVERGDQRIAHIYRTISGIGRKRILR